MLIENADAADLVYGAGLRAGDVIQKINGTAVSTHEAALKIFNDSAGTALKVEYLTAKEVGRANGELVLDVAAKAVYSHYFGPVPKTTGYGYLAFMTALNGYLLRFDGLTDGFFSPSQASEFDCSEYALIMADTTFGPVGEVFRLADATSFRKRWLVSTGAAPPAAAAAAPAAAAPAAAAAAPAPAAAAAAAPAAVGAPAAVSLRYRRAARPAPP